MIPAGGRGVLARLGRTAAAHPWRTLGAWLAAAALLVGLAASFGEGPTDDYTLPGTDSQTANELLTDRFPAASGTEARIVFHAPTGRVDDHARAVEATLAAAAQGPHVVAVEAPDAAAGSVSPDGRTAYATVRYDLPVTDVDIDASVASLWSAAAPSLDDGLVVELGGQLPESVDPSSGGAEAVGLAVAAVVLLVAFGSVVAMGVPIVVALVGLATGMSGVALVAAATEISTIGPTVATMVGLGVGIDYALFVVTRHREHLAAGLSVVDAAGAAVATAGRAVVFAGATVVVAICGLALVGVPLIASIGWATAVVVAAMVATAIIALPAVLGALGHRIDRWRPPLVGRRRGQGRAAARWADRVGRNPGRFAVAGIVAMLVLAAPLPGLRVAQGDAGTEPTSTSHRRAYDLLADGFGPGANGPLHVAIDLAAVAPSERDQVVEAVASAVRRDRSVVDVGPAARNAAGDTAVVVAVPATGPQEAQTSALVDRLRERVLPAATSGTGARAHVTGATALLDDLSGRISDRLPVFILAVVGVSLVLLAAMFRSILVPLKAALMNLLSIGAAYGVVVAVFQWGWGGSLLGLDGTVPISSAVPVMMFAILFGLSMDYEVFLLSRVREEYDRGVGNHQAVVAGLGSTARVITSAALIMVSVFLAFSASTAVTVKMIGLGLATAVLLDATVVRLVLVPSTMALLGDANWWLPRWADRALPRFTMAD